MRQLCSLYILFTLILLLLAPNLTKAELISEASEIPFQVNKSDRIMIGTVSGIDIHYNYTIYTITVEEWIYNPLPIEVIKIRTEIGTNFWTEDEAEFTQNESMIVMLKDENPDQQLFRVAIGFPGKHPVSDREVIINELKAQGKWQEEDQNKTDDTEAVENTEKADGQEEKSGFAQKSNSTPFISPAWTLVAILGAVICARRK